MAVALPGRTMVPLLLALVVEVEEVVTVKQMQLLLHQEIGTPLLLVRQ